jgi:hypothetical protein
VGDWTQASPAKSVLTQQEFEAEKIAKQRWLEESEQRKREAERLHEEQKQKIRDYWKENKLCLECGAKLSFLDKIGGLEYCKRHQK